MVSLRVINARIWCKDSASRRSVSVQYPYHANGNRTEKWTNNLFAARYFYDRDNQLVGISFNDDQDCQEIGDFGYCYDPFGRRTIVSNVNVDVHYYLYDGLDCIAELHNSENVTKWFVRGTGLGGGIGDTIAEITPTTTNYYTYNHRGDVVGLTTYNATLSGRFEYAAFGAPVTCNLSPATRRLGFSTKEFDERSGLSYYGFRYYDAESGRWMTKDPLGWEAGLHAYLALLNLPIMMLDPYGLRTCRILVKVSHGAPPEIFDPYDPKKDPDFTGVDKYAVVACWGQRYNARIPEEQRITGIPRTTYPLILAAQLDETMRYLLRAIVDARDMCTRDCKCDNVIVKAKCDAAGAANIRIAESLFGKFKWASDGICKYRKDVQCSWFR